ncbi:MAG TPA: PEP-CTERM sorting domain-containing protein, partial [Lacipirellulaceae bacterium]|nr:PEP-CTERM sorting domain-containing protein [Lacipirellulaceae bacterium]
GADYIVFRKGLGTTYTQDDYNAWRAHFGQTYATGAGAGATIQSVPEPATGLLLILGAVAAVGFAKRELSVTLLT